MASHVSLRQMNLFFTWDYELYFGHPTGTAQKCMIEPTEALLHIAAKYDARMTFFVDCGYLVKLNEFKKKYAAVAKEYDAVYRQIESIVSSGSEVQLHIHPHWQDSFYDGTEWEMDVKRYKLADFSKEEAAEIIQVYTHTLAEASGQKITAYRAGGWCMQPFSHIAQALKENGILIESSVFKGGHFQTDLYAYDFRKCPPGSRWRFSDDPCVEDKNGYFTELPISNYTLSPLFFWKLFALGRIAPENHKPVGNGKPVPSPGMRKKYLTRWNNHYVSGEGYFVSELNRAVKQHKYNDFTVLGHPKACTPYSLKKLDEFIQTVHKHHRVGTVSSVL